MSTDSGGLKKTIGLYSGITLALGIVVGAGMLSLPGLVYARANGWAALAWLADAVLVLPLLFIFAALGRRYPSAGGVAGFVGEAFPALRAGCAFMLAGTFALGLPAIALSGAGYLAGGFGLSGGGGRWLLTAMAAVLLAGSAAMTWRGASLSGTLQNTVVTALIGALVVIIATSVPRWGALDFTAGAPSVTGLWSGMVLAFFAYTGWEMLAFTAEEFRNPRRDFPLAVGISFAVVVALYVGVALAVQALVALDDPLLHSAPFLAVSRALFGPQVPPAVLGLLVAGVIFANLNGAYWAASRLVFDLGRSGWAPAWMSLQRLVGPQRVPRPAIVAVGAMMVGVLLLHGLGVLGLEDLLQLAGQNFFLLYAFSIIVFIRLSRGVAARLFGAVSLLICVAFARMFGWGLAYAAFLFVLPYAARALTGLAGRRTVPRT